MFDNIRVEEIGFGYGSIPVLRKISLQIPTAAGVGIVGRDGSGKTSFIEICAGLLRPSTGSVYWGEVDIGCISYNELLTLRKKTGFVFQRSALISSFTVFDNIALPLSYHSTISDREIRIRVKALLEELGLFNIERAFPEILTASQQKLVALARALVMEPELLFIDGLFDGLDSDTLQGVMNVLKGRFEKKQPTLLMTGYSAEIMRNLGCAVYVLDGGRLYLDKGDNGMLRGARATHVPKPEEIL